MVILTQLSEDRVDMVVPGWKQQRPIPKNPERTKQKKKKLYRERKEKGKITNKVTLLTLEGRKRKRFHTDHDDKNSDSNTVVLIK